MSKAEQKPVDGAKTGGMGLASIGDLSALMDAPAADSAGLGAPREFDVDLIDEDPNQPRLEDNPGFRPEVIAEIGETIKARGVKQPISLRDNPDSPGRYLINDGARRYRASKWAGKKTIPGFIDNDFVSDDQVVANIQREGHTPRELAKLIAQRLASGMKKSEIAKRWGKSAAYITQHAALLDLPPVIEAAFDSGRITDVTLINELVTAHKKAPEEVAEWLEDDSQEVTRGTVKLLREYLDDKGQDSKGESLAEQALREARERNGGGDEPPETEGEQGGRKDAPEADPTKLKKAIVQVEHDGRLARLTLNKRPSSAGLAWMKYEDDGAEFEAVLSDVKLVQLLEG